MDINLDAIESNARVYCDLCARNGISVAGVIKFSDGDLQVAKAYRDGGCAQLAVSRAKHLQALKEAYPETHLSDSPSRVLSPCEGQSRSPPKARHGGARA